MESIYFEVTKDILGYPGKMISSSKSFYRKNFPDHLVVFNANIFIGKIKIWYGDIDVTLSLDKLKEISSIIGEKIYLLSEMDGRFENEKKPRLENAVITIKPDGDFSLHKVFNEMVKNGELTL
jgi:hypothetical protein